MPVEPGQGAEHSGESRPGAVRATVVWAARPTSAKAGDYAIVSAEGEIDGFVGGDCTQASVRRAAQRCRASGKPLLLRVLPPGTTATGFPAEGEDQPGVQTVENPCMSGGALEIFLQPLAPPPLVVVHGDGPVARALLEAGPALGFETHGGPGAPRPPAAVVVATHGGDEAALLADALAAGAPYIGLVASRKRGPSVLGAAGIAEQDRHRVHSPAGLDIGARRPGEIAVSIFAEIVAVLDAAAAGSDDADSGSASPGYPGYSYAVPGAAPPAQPEAEDPVCHMTVVASDATLHVDLAGERYYFCCRHCLDVFVSGHAPAGT